MIIVSYYSNFILASVFYNYITELPSVNYCPGLAIIKPSRTYQLTVAGYNEADPGFSVWVSNTKYPQLMFSVSDQAVISTASLELLSRDLTNFWRS